MQMNTAKESQERLAAEQARVIQMWYEMYMRTVVTLAESLADFDATDVGRQRGRFEQFMRSIVTSEERVVGVFAVFKPGTIDLGMDALYAGTPGNTETGQWAPWCTQRSGAIEFTTFNDVPGMMSIINGPDARKQTIDDPVPLVVAGKNTYIVKVSAPVIYRRTGEVIGRVGMNVNTAYLQPIVNETVKNYADITVMSVYSDNATIVASYSADATYSSNQIGKLLKDAQGGLFNSSVNEAYNVALRGEKSRFSEYSTALKQDLELILYPFTVAETGVTWSLMLGTVKNIVMEDILYRHDDFYFHHRFCIGHHRGGG
jgi:hypothetical protein